MKFLKSLAAIICLLSGLFLNVRPIKSEVETVYPFWDHTLPLSIALMFTSSALLIPTKWLVAGMIFSICAVAVRLITNYGSSY